MPCVPFGPNRRWLFAIIAIFAIASLGAFGQGNGQSVAARTSSAPTLTQEEKAWILAHPVITVAVNHGWMPIEFLSEANQFRGISIDYLSHLEKILGIKFKKVSSAETPSAETADMLSAVSNKNLLKGSRFIALDKPHLSMPVAIFVLESNQTVHSLDDLHHKKVAVFKTGAVIKVLARHHPEIQLYKVDIAEEGLTALLTGKVDAYVGNKTIVSFVAHTQGLRRIKIAGDTPYTVSLSMAVRKDWPVLRSILQKGLAQIDADQQKSIMENWSEPAEKKSGSKLAFFISAALVAIIAVLGLRSWRLNKEIAQRKKMSQELIWRQANFDSLTQLPNRHMFRERLTHELQRSDRTGMPLALLFLDLDHFKEVNDSLGHGMGDILLVEAASRLKSCVRAIDTVARLGGDEFIVILSAMQESADVEIAAQKILSKMAEPFQLHNEMVYVSASIGITMYPEDATDAEILLKNADQAMYAAKSLGRNCLHYFTYAIQEAAKTKRHIANELRVAVAEQQFHLLYQPIVELPTGKVHKAEALIRWRHPERGVINPVQFISVAEDTGLIIPIGNWIFYEVAAQVAKWRDILHPGFQVSVNTSPIQFKNNGNFQDWIEHMHNSGLPGQSIVIEITEGLLLEKNTAVKFQLSEFRNAGVQIAIDDFGTGYSSLSYLKKFDVDYVKIDRSFISNLTGESDDMALCEAIISMAHKLDLKVVAEGIETAEQQSLLIKAGCDYGQGYFFAKPLSPPQLENYIKESTGQ